MIDIKITKDDIKKIQEGKRQYWIYQIPKTNDAIVIKAECTRYKALVPEKQDYKNA